MKVTSINTYKTYNPISFKKNDGNTAVNYEKPLSVTVPADTTQFKSSIKKTEPSILKKIGNAVGEFFNEPSYTPGFEELIARSPYVY